MSSVEVKFAPLDNILEVNPIPELFKDDTHLLTLLTRLKRLMLCDLRARDLRNFDPDYTSLNANCGLILRLGYGLCIIYEVGNKVEITMRILHDETMIDCKILSFPQHEESISHAQRFVEYYGQQISISSTTMPRDYYSPVVSFMEKGKVSLLDDSHIVEEFMEILYDYTDYAKVIESLEND